MDLAAGGRHRHRCAVWRLIAQAGAVLSSMLAYSDGDADLARSALRLQAGLWMWSGAYFGGLASDAPRGTIPSIVS